MPCGVPQVETGPSRSTGLLLNIAILATKVKPMPPLEVSLLCFRRYRANHQFLDEHR